MTVTTRKHKADSLAPSDADDNADEDDEPEKDELEPSPVKRLCTRSSIAQSKAKAHKTLKPVSLPYYLLSLLFNSPF